MHDIGGSIAVTRVGTRIVMARGRGHIRLDHLLAAQTEIEELFRPIVGTVDLIFDGTAVDYYEPGLPMRWVRWGAAHAERAGRVAIVARSGPMIGVAKAIPLLMPSTRFAIFTDRAAAIAFLRTANNTDARRGT